MFHKSQKITGKLVNVTVIPILYEAALNTALLAAMRYILKTESYARRGQG